MYNKIKIEKGAKFPDNYNTCRISNESKWEKMFLSEYVYNYAIVPKKDGTATQKPIDPFVPIPALVSEIHSDLLFGEFPAFEGSADAQSKAMGEYVRLHPEFKTDYLEAGAYCSAMGQVFHCLYKVGEKIYHKFIKSNTVMWEQDDIGLTRVVIFELDQNKSNSNQRVYELQEFKFTYNEAMESPWHDNGRKLVITDSVITVDRIKNEIKNIEETKVQNTGWDFMPIRKTDNIRQMGINVGKSDYQGKEQLFAEIDARIDQINYCLQENQDPWVIVPNGVLNEKGQFNRHNGKMIQRSTYEGDNTVDVVSWDPQLEGAFRQIETMIEMVFFTSRISAPIAGLDKGGNVESGRALRWKSINTFSMINRKRRYWEEDFRWYFETAGKMGGMEVEIQASDITVVWNDGLPLDAQEVVENVVKQVNAGLMSHLTAIKETRELDDAGASKEMEQIKAEKQSQADIESTRFKVTL